MPYRRGPWVFLALLILTGLLAVPARAAEPTVQMAQHASLGTMLTDARGMTLYRFTTDPPGMSNCHGQCAANWPPLTVRSGDDVAAPAGLPGKLGTAARPDGTLQVTYNDMPLYLWVRDKVPGDTTGHQVNGVWFAVNPAPATVQLARHATLGTAMAGPDGMTLYMFTKDSAGTSNCYGACATNWPPLLLRAGEQPIAPAGLGGKLGTTTRTDGSIQVTFNGMPLYYWARDLAPGDATGHLVGGVWFASQPGLLPDVAGHWSQAQVAGAVAAGWVGGHPDGTFQPGSQVTRAEFVKMLTAAFGTPAGTGSTFADTGMHWAAPHIEGAVAAGMIRAADYAGANFAPDRALTRAEAAVMLVRALHLEDMVAGGAVAVQKFADAGSLDAAVKGYVGVAAGRGILMGYPDGTAGGGRIITRAEAVVLVVRALGQKKM